MLTTILIASAGFAILSLLANLVLWSAAVAAGRRSLEERGEAESAYRTLAQAEEELHTALVRQNELTLRTVEAERMTLEAHRVAMACRHLPVLPTPAGPRKLRPFQVISLN